MALVVVWYGLVAVLVVLFLIEWVFLFWFGGNLWHVSPEKKNKTSCNNM